MAAGALLLVIAHSAPVAGHSTCAEISVARGFSRSSLAAGDIVDVTITVDIGDIGADPLRGFYLADHIPEPLVATVGRVTVDGSVVAAIAESSEAGGIYAGCTTQRWVLETPPGFGEQVPLAAGTTLVVSYSVQVPAGAFSGSISFPGFTWVGMISAQGSAGDHFGFEEGEPSLTVTGGVDPGGDRDAGPNPADDPNGNLTGGCSVDGPGPASAGWLIVLVALGTAWRRRRRAGA